MKVFGKRSALEISLFENPYMEYEEYVPAQYCWVRITYFHIIIHLIYPATYDNIQMFKLWIGISFFWHIFVYMPESW